MAQLAKKKKTNELDALIAQWEARWRTYRLLLNLPRLLAVLLVIAVVVVLVVRATGVLPVSSLLPILGVLLVAGIVAIIGAFWLRRRPAGRRFGWGLSPSEEFSLAELRARFDCGR